MKYVEKDLACGLGGEEPFTGNRLQVCNECGAVLKQIDAYRNNANSEECQKLIDQLLEKCVDTSSKQILNTHMTNILHEISRNDQKKDFDQQMQEKIKEISKALPLLLKNFKTTTGYSFDDYHISQYIGIVSGEVVIGTGFLSEFESSISDFLVRNHKHFRIKCAKQKRQHMTK